MMSDVYSQCKIIKKNTNALWTAKELRSFEMNFDIYVAAAWQDADDKTIACTFLNLAGKEAIERAGTFLYGVGESVEQKIQRAVWTAHVSRNFTSLI